MIWWHMVTSCVDFCGSENPHNPANDVLGNPLIELMQHVRCNGTVDVHIR